VQAAQRLPNNAVHPGIRGALDLSELDLEEVPPQIFDIAGLKVLLCLIQESMSTLARPRSSSRTCRRS